MRPSLGDPRGHQRPDLDLNAVVSGYLRDLAFAQTSPQKTFGYKRAAAAIFSLEQQLTELVRKDGTLPKIPGIGPASTRVITEVLAGGTAPSVETAIDASGRRPDIERRRGLREAFLSRAEVLRVLRDPHLPALTCDGYRGDLQMHSTWSDGSQSVEALAAACAARGYDFAAITDHSHGLKIAGGMTMEEAARQRAAIAQVNARMGPRFRLLQGIEANIGLDGTLDLSDSEALQFEVVLAAPHARLRRSEDQTARMLAAVRHPHVHILAHPRGRIVGSRGGVVADWEAVFREAAAHGVAVEIDGDPARQDLDHRLAAQALAVGCLFALDSDAHAAPQLGYAETALAHARLTGIPPDRILNFWPTDRLLEWLSRARAR